MNFPHGWNLTFIPFQDVNEKRNAWITQIQSNQQNFWQLSKISGSPCRAKSSDTEICPKTAQISDFCSRTEIRILVPVMLRSKSRLFRWSRNHRIRKVDSRKPRLFGILPVATFACRWQTSPNMRETAERIWRQMYLFWSKETCSWDFDDQTDQIFACGANVEKQSFWADFGWIPFYCQCLFELLILTGQRRCSQNVCNT